MVPFANSFTCSIYHWHESSQSMDTSRAFVFAFVPTRGRTLAQTTRSFIRSGIRPGFGTCCDLIATACWLLRFPTPTSHVLHLLPSLQTTFPHSSSPSTDSSTEYTYTTNPAIVAGYKYVRTSASFIISPAERGSRAKIITIRGGVVPLALLCFCDLTFSRH